MKSLAAIAVFAATLALSACGDSEEPAAETVAGVPADAVTVPVEGEGWTADTAKPGDVDVNLPESQVDMNAPVAGDADAGSKTIEQ